MLYISSGQNFTNKSFDKKDILKKIFVWVLEYLAIFGVPVGISVLILGPERYTARIGRQNLKKKKSMRFAKMRFKLNCYTVLLLYTATSGHFYKHNFSCLPVWSRYDAFLFAWFANLGLQLLVLK